ncbi:hypothetical protein KTQ74_23955 [Pseudomonas chlororaphis]|uniref:hypothetical protein n=1 Tax=Pseudomonas chlororaphis TaxID=587753 RepID=UPI001E5908EE|nr:hypothetical protein [Pseudomonas chlororaphis]MCB2254979.1 hypothetical protein [Pseudomonas chlororaphis]
MEREATRCFIGGMAVREIAKTFDHSAQIISTRKATAFHKAGAIFDIECFEFKYMLVAT